MVTRVREVEEVDIHLEHEASEGPRCEVAEQRADEAGHRALREVGLHQLAVRHAHRLQGADQRPALVDHFAEHDVEHEDGDAHENQRQQDTHGQELVQLAVHHVVARLVRPLREGLETVALELRPQGIADILVAVAGREAEAEFVSHIAHAHQVLHVVEVNAGDIIDFTIRDHRAAGRDRVDVIRRGAATGIGKMLHFPIVHEPEFRALRIAVDLGHAAAEVEGVGGHL